MTSSTMKRIGMSILTAICLLTFVAPSVATPLQTPPDEQNPWLCYDLDGWERPCTATEEFWHCLEAAGVAEMQCVMATGDGKLREALCAGRRSLDEAACWAEFIGIFWFF